MKTAKKSPYYSFLTKDERKHLQDIPIGDLAEEIRCLKTILSRYLQDFNTDPKYIKGLTDLINAIRGLEKDHYELIGGVDNKNPLTMAQAMRQAAQETDLSVVDGTEII